MPPKPWKVVDSTWDRTYRVFSLRTDQAISPRTGKTHPFFILESASWVNVIPLTSEEEVVLIRQYRHGTRSVTLEIPGGLVEDSDTPEGAAGRELLEETGYVAKEMVSLGWVHPNPAILNNRCYTFLALNVAFSGARHQDDREDIEVLLRPLSAIPAMIRDGEISHSLVITAFYRFFVEYQAGFFR